MTWKAAGEMPAAFLWACADGCDARAGRPCHQSYRIEPLLAHAERREDAADDIVGGHAAGQFFGVIEGGAEEVGEEFGIAQGAVGR